MLFLKGFSMVSVSIGVITQGTKQSYLEVLWASLLNQLYVQPVEIVIFSEEGFEPSYPLGLTSRYAIHHFFYQRPFNIGSIRNKVASIAQGQYLIYLDDDVAIGPHYLQTLVSILEIEQPAVLAGLSYQVFKRPSEVLQLLHQILWENLIVRVGRRDYYTQRIGRYDTEMLSCGDDNWLGAIGRNMVIDRKIALSSPFIELDIMGFEDLEFAYRQQQAGKKIILRNTPHLACLHLFHNQNPAKLHDYARAFQFLVERDKLPSYSRKWFFPD